MQAPFQSKLERSAAARALDKQESPHARTAEAVLFLQKVETFVLKPNTTDEDKSFY